MSKAFHLKHWDELYETAQTRQVRVLSYYSKPNKLVGEGLGHMMSQPDGLALYGTWTFLEVLASTAPQFDRGWLVRNGTPMDATRIASLMRLPIEPVERALKFFSTAPMDWLEELEWEGSKQAEPKIKTEPPSARHQHAISTPSARHQHADGISVRGKTDKSKTEDSEERERENGGFATKGEARAAQREQRASAKARLKDLASVAEEDRTPDQEAEFAKLTGLVREIEKKQRGGDFTPVQIKNKTI